MSPKIFLDTNTRINDLISKIKTSDFARSFFITGVRGSGKTVFLTQWLKNWIKMIIVNGLHDYCKKQWENFEYHLSNGESLKEVQERNIKALENI